MKFFKELLTVCLTQLHFLNNGYKINEIAEELSVSESTIKKRISKIKQTLELNEHDNLLKETKKRGYL